MDYTKAFNEFKRLMEPRIIKECFYPESDDGKNRKDYWIENLTDEYFMSGYMKDSGFMASLSYLKETSTYILSVTITFDLQENKLLNQTVELVNSISGYSIEVEQDDPICVLISTEIRPNHLSDEFNKILLFSDEIMPILSESISIIDFAGWLSMGHGLLPNLKRYILQKSIFPELLESFYDVSPDSEVSLFASCDQLTLLLTNDHYQIIITQEDESYKISIFIPLQASSLAEAKKILSKLPYEDISIADETVEFPEALELHREIYFTLNDLGFKEYCKTATKQEMPISETDLFSKYILHMAEELSVSVY